MKKKVVRGEGEGRRSAILIFLADCIPVYSLIYWLHEWVDLKNIILLWFFFFYDTFHMIKIWKIICLS